jgi:hypothetical protein
MTTFETVKIQIDDQVIELTGKEKDAFLLDLEAIEQSRHLAEMEKQAKQEAAHAKLAALGLTADDLKALGL